jgi:outer membrane lipoprotein-sorting protein
MTLRNFSFMLAGALMGTAMAMFMQHRPVPATCAEIGQKIEDYRACMQSTGRTGCNMQVEDFADFHNLKRQLGRCKDDRSNDKN